MRERKRGRERKRKRGREREERKERKHDTSAALISFFI